MYLTHICKKCKREYEKDSVPNENDICEYCMIIKSCNRCNKKSKKLTGTPNFKICKDCFNELQNQE